MHMKISRKKKTQINEQIQIEQYSCNIIYEAQKKNYNNNTYMNPIWLENFLLHVHCTNKKINLQFI